ncbi:MAG: PAS domain S-box protein [Nitrospirota bacterium]
MRLPSPLKGSRPLHCLVAVGVVLLATGSRMLLDPLLGDRDPFVTFILAVLIAILYTDTGASLLALGLALLSANYFFIAPRGSLAIAAPADRLDFGLYLFIGLVAVGLIQWQRRARHAAETSMADELAKRSALEREIRERRRAEEALRHSEQQFSSAFENAAIGMALVAPDGRWLKVNRSLCDLTGYSAEELLAKTFQDITHPDDLERDLDYVRQMLAGEIHTYQMEKRYFHKLGHTVWILLSVSLVRDTQGRPVHFISQIQGITERKSAEEALRQSEAQLRHAQKMEAVGRLAGGLAHDFNNLLMVINGYSVLLLEEYGTDQRLRTSVQQIKQATESAASLIQQLLAFSRKQVLVPTVIDLNAVVSRMSAMLQRLLGEDIDLSTDLDQTVGPVKADEGQMQQVIMNLAVNARDAMRRGGRLTIETRNRDITESARHGQIVRPGRYVTLSVSDTGCGMDPETQARIFEPFFTTKPVGEGTGLGLSTVYGIVKQSGGYVFVYSEPGRGSTFRIYLPRIDGAAKPVERAPSEETAMGGTETILLAEDQPGVRTLVRETLASRGYTVLEARHGFEALMVANQSVAPIHLLLTDVVMPQMSGPELADRLRPIRPDMKVLYMSGYSDAAVVHHGKINPGTFFLPKPIEAAVLLRTVREILDAPRKI